jgi:transposase
MHAYSQDLRERVLRALERGDRPAAIARRFEVSRVGVYQVRERLEKTGKRCSLPMGGHRRSRIAGMEQVIRGWIKAEPDMTLAQLRERLLKEEIAIKIPALWHQLDKWGLTLKKNPARQRARARRRTGGTA